MTDTMPRQTSVQPGPLPRPQRRRWRLLWLGLLILLCGALIGSGGTILVLHRVIQYAVHHPEEVPARVVDRMRTKLGIDNEQAGKIRRIVRQHQQAIWAIRREAQPKLERELELVKEEVSAVLTPEQARKFRERMDDLRRQWIPRIPPLPQEPEGEMKDTP